MKKNIVLLLLAFMFFVGTSEVKATCDATENNKLTGLAVNIKANYEVAEEEIPWEENFNAPDGLTKEELENYKMTKKYFKISISNLTEDVYIEVSDNIKREVKQYNYSDSENGLVIIKQDISYDITNYTITVYSSMKTNCVGTKLRTIYLTTPAYNPYSEYAVCEDIKNFYLCHEYLSVDVKFDDFYTQVDKYQKGTINDEGEEKEIEDSTSGFQKFFKENKIAIIVAGVLIVAGGATLTVVLVKRQRSKIV